MITLTRQTCEPSESDLKIVWPLRVTATSSGDLPAAIFVYHCGAFGDPDADVFECVASPVQIEQLPETRPTGDNLLLQPYYRQSEVVIFCASAQQAADVWEELKAEAINLVAEWRDAATLEIEDTYTVP